MAADRAEYERRQEVERQRHEEKMRRAEQTTRRIISGVEVLVDKIKRRRKN
jgi:hypothetical protein